MLAPSSTMRKWYSSPITSTTLSKLVSFTGASSTSEGISEKERAYKCKPLHVATFINIQIENNDTYLRKGSFVMSAISTTIFVKLLRALHQ